MTPSGWHDDTQSRDAGHDTMQLAVWNYLRSKPHRITNIVGVGHCERTDVTFEHPFVLGGRIVAWGDVVERFIEHSENGTHPSHVKAAYAVFEIKPKIYSVGGIVRQCLSLEFTAKQCGHDRERIARAIAIPVVKYDDQKLSMLRQVWPLVAEWDGSALRYNTADVE